MNFIFKWSTPYLTSERSERVWYWVEHEKIKFMSIREYVIFCLLYKHKWNTKSAWFQRHHLLCNHNDGDLFACEDNMLSSRVKIWSFRGKAHFVFHWCLYNKPISLMFDHALYYIHKTINNWFMYSFQPEGLNSKIALTGNLFLLIIIDIIIHCQWWNTPKVV